jgi:hypothetical protein
MKPRSVWKNLVNGKTVRRHTIPPDQQWTWWTIEMMRSPAYRALSISAHRVIARIRIELGDHGGQDNGRLPVTHRNFHDYGIAWSEQWNDQRMERLISSAGENRSSAIEF